MYGDSAAHMTMNRAAYGDVPAAMMANGGGGYGNNVPDNGFSQVGGKIMPVGYTPPARINMTYSGLQAAPTGFFGGAANYLGLKSVSRSTMTADNIYNTSSDFGERVGGGMATAGIMAGGVAAGAAIEPVVSRAAAAAAKTAGMGALGGGAVGLAAGFAAPMAAMAAADGVATAVNERRHMNNFLEAQSSRFVGAGSAMSSSNTRGMSRAARAEFTDFVKKMDVGDKAMDMGDLQHVLESGTSKGLFSGAGGDMDSFKKKFKEITNAVKVVTRTLGKTLEEGMKTLQELKSIGVDPSKAREFVTKADSMGRVAGISGAEMTQVGLQGANMFRGTGISMDIGAQANMMNMASVHAARDAGSISEEAIMQAGGEAAMSQRMTASGLAFSQSSMGRGMTAAFVQGGALNSKSFMANAFSGGGDVRQLGVQAAKNIASPNDLIAYQANQEEIVSEMGKKFGGQGLQIAQMNGAMAQASMMASTGIDMKNAFKATLKAQGMSSQEVEMRMAQINKAGSNFEAMQAGVAKTMNSGIVEEAVSNSIYNRTSSAVGDFFKKGYDVVAKPVSGFISDTQAAMTTFKEEQIYGIQSASMKDVDGEVPTFLGGKKVTPSMLQGLKKEHKLGGRYFGTEQTYVEGEDSVRVNLDKGGGLGGKTVGEELMDAIDSGEFKALGITAESTKSQALSAKGTQDKKLENAYNTGQAVKVDSGLTGTSHILMNDKLEEMKKFVANSSMTASQASAMKKRGALKDVHKPNIGALLASGSFDHVESVDDLVGAVYGEGKNRGNISQAEYASLMDDVQGTVLQKHFDNARKTAGTIGAASRTKSIGEMQNYRESYDSSMEELEDKLGGKLTGTAAAKLAAANQAENQGKDEQAAKLRNEATMEIAKSNKDMKTEDIAAFVQSAKGGDLDGTLEVLNASRAGMQQVQQKIGENQMAGALVGSLSGKEMDDVDQSVKDKIRDVAAKLSSAKGDITQLTGEDIATISKGGDVGKAMAGRLTQIQKLASGDVKDMDRSDLRDTLEATLGEGRASSVIEDLDADRQVDFSALAGEAKKKFAKGVAGKEFKSAASAGSVEEGTESAMELAKTQTSINMQVLTAMEALAQRIR